MLGESRTRSVSVPCEQIIRLRGMLAFKMKQFCSFISSLAPYTECRADSAVAMVCIDHRLQVAEHEHSDSFMSKMSNLSFELRTHLKNGILEILI
jgi:hypothetical protein